MWKEEEYGQGKCINCGYLGKKDNTLGQECHTAKDVERTEGNLSHHIVPGIVQLDTIPWCFVGKANLKKELDQTETQSQRIPLCLGIINKDRKCTYWYPWTEYFSPKEHFEEFKMLQLEQSRQDFEQRMEKERKEFDLKIAEMTQKVQKDSKDIVEKSDKFNRKITLFIIILAALEVAGTLLALFFPNGFNS